MDQNTESTFRAADREIANNSGTTNIPQCIKDLPTPDPSRSSLTESQLSAEMSRLQHKEFTKLEFPRVRRFNVDPAIPHQKFGLISFIPSKNACPDNDGCYGVIKLRGNFSTEQEADKWSERLIRDFDNFAEIDYAFVGNYFPLMDSNEIYTRSTREIDIDKKKWKNKNKLKKLKKDNANFLIVPTKKKKISLMMTWIIMFKFVLRKQMLYMLSTRLKRR